MRNGIKVLVIAATLALAWAPAKASADGFISPWIGANFNNGDSDRHGTWGVTAGGMGGGVIGGEVDFGYSPSFWGDPNVFGGNNVMTVMGNLIVGIPIGGQRGLGIRPFVTGGVGLVRTNLDVPGPDNDLNNNDFGFNFGAGVMGFFNDHVGVGGNIRYFRTVNEDARPNVFDLDLGGFDFWRASIGLVLR